MTQIVVGIEQLLFLLKKEDIVYKKEDPGESTDPNWGIIETERGIMA